MLSSIQDQFKGWSLRQLLLQGLNFFMIIGSVFMLWKGWSLFANSESPIVVVLSESMEPAFQRGDLLFLTMPTGPIRVGDITVFKLQGKKIPVVHRILTVHDEDATGKQYILTKGDNNLDDDRVGGIYNSNQMWINREDVTGKVQGFIPYAGMVTIIMDLYPQLKYALLGALGLLVVFQRD